MEKPFSIKVLSARLYRLIASRQRAARTHRRARVPSRGGHR